MTSSNYMRLLEDLNLQDDNDITKNDDAKRAICPIAYAEIDSRDHASTITIISDTVIMTEQEKMQLVGKLFDISKDSLMSVFICNHVDTFDLESAYEWFIKTKNEHPTSRRQLTDNELKRLEFRYNMRTIIQLKPSLEDIQSCFIAYLKDVHENNIDLSSKHVELLRCHLSLEHLSNYVQKTRSDAIRFITSINESGSSLAWIARLSQAKGYEFVKDSKNEYHHATEHIAITCFNNGTIVNFLIERVYARGYYSNTGTYLKDRTGKKMFENERGLFTVCFFDILHHVIKYMHSMGVDVRQIILPSDNIILPKNPSDDIILSKKLSSDITLLENKESAIAQSVECINMVKQDLVSIDKKVESNEQTSNTVQNFVQQQTEQLEPTEQLESIKPIERTQNPRRSIMPSVHNFLRYLKFK